MFKVKRPDGRSDKQVLLDVMQKKKPGDIASYEELGKALGFDPVKDRSRIQGLVRRTNKSLLKHFQRGFQSVTNVGYRMLEAREHVFVASGHQSKADRQLVKAIQFYDGAKLEEMTQAERQLHIGQQMLAKALYASHKHLDKRVKRIEDLLNDPSYAAKPITDVRVKTIEH